MCASSYFCGGGWGEGEGEQDVYLRAISLAVSLLQLCLCSLNELLLRNCEQQLTGLAHTVTHKQV